MFNFAGDSDVLSRNDANHVQIIHTNAGGLGYMCPYGHSDFYPNGGSAQPGCCDDLISCTACSHDRSVYFFAESISKSFVGIACDSYENYENGNCGDNPQAAMMGGLNLASVTPGTYYLHTGSVSPYSRVTPGLARGFPEFVPKITHTVCSLHYLTD